MLWTRWGLLDCEYNGKWKWFLRWHFYFGAHPEQESYKKLNIRSAYYFASYQKQKMSNEGILCLPRFIELCYT